MSKKRKKTGKEASGMTRRDMLKIGAGAAGAAAVIGPTMLTSSKTYAFQGVAEPIICDVEPENSPPHTPFRDNLPIPSPAIPTISVSRPDQGRQHDQGRSAQGASSTLGAVSA